MTEKLYFENAFHSTFGVALKDKLTSHFRARLKAELDLDLEKLRPAYPYTTLVSAIRMTQAELFPGVPSEESEAQLGALAFRGFASTMIGRAIVQITKLLGPARSLARMTHNTKSSMNFMDLASRKLGPGCYELETDEIGELPFFYQGMFQEGLSATAKNLRVEVVSTDGHHVLYRISWTP
ncbi:MAG: DUF2378 family protein [Myxococcales bacterium]|nr:DUF2378 family protein [Myxococcales bacterium]